MAPCLPSRASPCHGRCLPPRAGLRCIRINVGRPGPRAHASSYQSLGRTRIPAILRASAGARILPIRPGARGPGGTRTNKLKRDSPGLSGIKWDKWDVPHAHGAPRATSRVQTVRPAHPPRSSHARSSWRDPDAPAPRRAPHHGPVRHLERRARRLREVKRKLRNPHTREGADAGRCVAAVGLQPLGRKSAAPATHGSTKSHSPDTVLGETNHWPKRVSLQCL